MRIMFLARSLGCGGAERQLSQLARELRSAGDEVCVALLYGGGDFEQDVTAAGVPLIQLHKKGFWDFAGVLLRLVAAARRFEPDAVYSFMLGPNILAALAKPFLGRARVVWGIRSSATDWRVYGRRAVVAARLERWLSPFSDLVICNSEAGRHEVIEHGFPAARTMVIANGIDTAVFRPDTKARQRMRATLGLQEAQIAIGIVGRLDPHKGHRLFFDSAQQIAGQLPQAVFVCVGDGPQKFARELKRYAESRVEGRRVIWAGQQTDMVGVYNALDTLALTSIGGDGFPNVLAEAMACGTPCIATRAGDSERILNNSDWVVSRQDAAAIAAAVISVVQLPRSEVSKRLRNRILENFSIAESTRMTRCALEIRADR